MLTIRFFFNDKYPVPYDKYCWIPSLIVKWVYSKVRFLWFYCDSLMNAPPSLAQSQLKLLSLFASVYHYRVGEGRAYWSLGNAHTALGNHEQAMYFAEKHLEIAKEVTVYCLPPQSVTAIVPHHHLLIGRGTTMNNTVFLYVQNLYACMNYFFL